MGIVSPYPEVPLLQQDLIGNARNYYTTKSRGFTFGRCPDVDNVLVDLWEGGLSAYGPSNTYVFPAAAQQMTVVSTSANDTLAGTGMQKLMIHYLDNSYAAKTEIVSLNGIAPVNTVATNILRINGVHATQVGTGGISAGNIAITNTAQTITYALISAGRNTARQAIYTVPAGVTGYIDHWQASSGSSGNHFCQITLRATTHDNVLYPGVFLIQDEVGTENNGQPIEFPIPIPIPATADVKLSAISDSAAANVIALGAIMGWFE